MNKHHPIGQYKWIQDLRGQERRWVREWAWSTLMGMVLVGAILGALFGIQSVVGV